MAVLSAPLIVWWIELAGVVPWFFSGAGAGQGGSALAPQLIVAAAMMVTSMLAAGRSSVRAVIESRMLRRREALGVGFGNDSISAWLEMMSE
jgi:hypothetical protein